jgi:GGDEF domain-containing protein
MQPSRSAACGEKFVLYLPHTGDIGQVAFVDRFQTHPTSRLASAGGPLTVSIGAAVVNQSDADWTGWLAPADEALYRQEPGAGPVLYRADAFRRNQSCRRGAECGLAP